MSCLHGYIRKKYVTGIPFAHKGLQKPHSVVRYPVSKYQLIFFFSGRGLGITGGTLDKLESIPNFNVILTSNQIIQALEQIGCVIAGQTGKIAPADKLIYACRDNTNTVGNLSLQTSSILSKKAAESLHTLVLDVKYGRGCYQPTLEYAEKVANSLVNVASR